MKNHTINQMSSEALKSLYPISVSEWFSRTVSSRLNFQSVQSIINEHPPPTGGGAVVNVLDWGCGNLLWALGLFPGAQLTGVEISEDNLRYARLNAKLNHHSQDFIDILYNKNVIIPENTYDYSLCFGLVELINDDEFSDIFNIIFKALRPGGKLVVTSHNWRQFSAVYLPWLFRGGYTGYTKKLGQDIQKKSLSSLASDFTNLGYVVVDSGGFNPYPSKLWSYISSDKFYLTRNQTLAVWYYTQFLVLHKPVV